MPFRIRGLDPGPFIPLYGLGEEELAARGVTRTIADRTPGYPDRIELVDVEPGTPVLLLNYLHQPAPTAYRSSHAIFVREGAMRAYDGGQVPAVFRPRPLSVRAFDARHQMVDAELIAGADVDPLFERWISVPTIEYLHVHYAVRGCFAARVERAAKPQGGAGCVVDDR